MDRSPRAAAPAAIACLGLLLASCSSLYYDTMEAFGKEKRHILSDRVKSARDDQQEAKKQFQTALEQFKSVVKVEGGQLESKYDALQREYDRSEARATRVRERVESVKKVAKDLFAEWNKENAQYTDAALREQSEKNLAVTQERYQKLIGTMEKASLSMDPVLKVFKDRVLFLKHNLNATAIASLEGTLQSIETDVGALVRDMEKSIEEANQFIGSLGTGA